MRLLTQMFRAARHASIVDTLNPTEVNAALRELFVNRLSGYSGSEIAEASARATEVVVEASKVRSASLDESDFLKNMGLEGDVDFNYSAKLVLDSYCNIVDGKDPYLINEAVRVLKRAAALLALSRSGMAVR